MSVHAAAMNTTGERLVNAAGASWSHRKREEELIWPDHDGGLRHPLSPAVLVYM